jgi:hypothetical protein
LTQDDVLALGQRYVERFPDRTQAILLVGLRTSGSYFAPLLRALFEAKGYEKVALITLVPGKGAGRWEGKELKRCAGQGYTAVIVDDPPHTGGTILTAFEIARRAGFAPGKLRALVPAHPARPDWFKPLPDDFVVSLEPEQWRKRALMDPREVQGRLAATAISSAPTCSPAPVPRSSTRACKMPPPTNAAPDLNAYSKFISRRPRGKRKRVMCLRRASAGVGLATTLS